MNEETNKGIKTNEELLAMVGMGNSEKVDVVGKCLGTTDNTSKEDNQDRITKALGMGTSKGLTNEDIVSYLK